MRGERSPSGSNPGIELPHGQGKTLARVVMAGIAEVTGQTVDKIGAFDLLPPGMGQNLVRKHLSQKIAGNGCRAVAVSGMRYGDAQSLFEAGGDASGVEGNGQGFFGHPSLTQRLDRFMLLTVAGCVERKK